MIEEKGYDCPPKSLAERRRSLDGSVQDLAPGTRSISAAVHAEAERGIGWGREALWLLGGQQPEDQPRGFLRAGSWVTARATESRPRSQVYLRRHRWVGVRQVGPEHPRGRRMVPQLEGKVLPCTHAFPAGTRRLSSGARLRCSSPIVTTEEPSWERGAGEQEWRPLGLDTYLGVPESVLAGRPWEPFQVLGIQGPAAAWSPGARGCHPPPSPHRQGPHLPIATATHPRPVSGPCCCLVHGQSPGRKQHTSFWCFCPTQEMALNLLPRLGPQQQA